jgi:hypothetical protein
MNRTQIQLPDQLYQRAKQWAEIHECSLAELTRRGLETYLDRYPEPMQMKGGWQIPVVDLGKPKMALEDLREHLAGIESRADV